MQVSWCRPWGTLPSGQVNNSRNLMLFPVCHGNIQKVSRGAERSPGLRLFGKPNKKVCPQIFEKKKKKICGQTFHFLPLFSTSHIASKFNWRSQSFIFMFSRKQMFSPVCPIRKKKKKKKSNFSNRLFYRHRFSFLFGFFEPKIEKLPSPREMLWFRGVFVLFCFSLSTDGSRCNQTNVLMWDFENCCVPNKPSVAKQPDSLRLFHTSKALKRHRWSRDAFSYFVIIQIFYEPSNLMYGE